MISLDLEAYQIEPGCLTPRLVCGSTARVVAGAVVGELLDRAGALAAAREMLVGDDTIAGANVAFDFGVLMNEDPTLVTLVFAAYDAGRVHDVQVAQALHAIAEGNLYLDPRTGEELRDPETKRRRRYSLDVCTQLVLGRGDAKARDRWRRTYALLEDVPQAEWPEDARRYPVDDAVNTLEVALAQVRGGGAGVTPGPHRNLGDLPDQCRAALALHLGAAWGLRTDRGRIAALRAWVEREHASYVARHTELGYYVGGERDARAVKRAVVRAYGGGAACPSPTCVGGRALSPVSGNPVWCKVCSGTALDPAGAPRTPTGGVKADRDVLAESGDPDLEALGLNEVEKVRDTYLPFLETGVDRPITLRANVLVASGRTSYDGLIQILPHSTDVESAASAVRACFRARPGYLYCSVDYAAIELCTLAQVCLWVLGRSQMAETINATGKPGSLHDAFAARLAGVPHEEMSARIRAKDKNALKYRQAAKAGNFGFPGGMGGAKFVHTKRKRSEGETVCPDGHVHQGIRFCVLLADAPRCSVRKVTEWKGRTTPPICAACVEVVEHVLRPAWFATWPEIKPYFAWVTSRVDAGADMPCLGTHRVRGGCGFTDGANNGFQALAADGAKRALWALARECYTDHSSPLWGSRPISFVHDEIVAELVEERAHLAGPRMADVMVSSMRELVEDVTVEAKPALMRLWYKEAEAVYDGDRLVPWEPRA